MVDYYSATRLVEASKYIRELLNNTFTKDKYKLCPKAANLSKLPHPGGKINHAAVDGGSSTIDFQGFSFYYVKAWAHLHETGTSCSDAWLGIVVPPHHPDYRVSVYREILEASSISGLLGDRCSSIAEMADLVLFDGSLRNAIRWWSPGATSYSSEELARMTTDLYKAEEVLWDLYNGGASIDSLSHVTCSSRDECAEELIANSPNRPVTARLVLELAAKGLLDGLLDDGGKWVTAIEVLEKLYAYKKAIEDSWLGNGIAMFLSKQSVSTTLCRGKHSDIYYIRRLHQFEPGYIVWKGDPQTKGRGSLLVGAYEITRLSARNLRGGFLFYPKKLGIHRFYTERLASIEFYVRLEKGGPFLLSNIAFDSEKIEPSWDNALGLLEKALRMLVSVPLSQGYPLALTISHYHARILPEEAYALARGVGLELEYPARSMIHR